MGSAKLQGMVADYNYSDCSEIANSLAESASGTGGSVAHLEPAAGQKLLVPEVGERGEFQFAPYDYHEVFTDGRYVYDPRLAQEPIPSGDYFRVLQQKNKGMSIQWK